MSALRAYSKSYKKDAHFVARAARNADGRIQGGWLLIEKDGSKDIDISADTIEDFTQQGFEWLASYWAKKYAVKTADQADEVLVNIYKVSSYQDYEQILEYFQGLEFVDNAFVLNVNEQSLQLAVALKSDLQQFKQQLSLNAQLSLKTDAGSEFDYDWLGSNNND